MAGKFAQLHKQIWADPDWRTLSASEQWLYLHLVSRQELTWAGTCDWFPKRICQVAAGLSVDEVTLAASVLQAKGYIVVDDADDRVLIRSFHRNQEGMLRQPNMGTAVLTAWLEVESLTLRGVITYELLRLRTEEPKWASWERMLPVLEAVPLDPRQFRVGPVGLPPAMAGGANEPPF